MRGARPWAGGPEAGGLRAPPAFSRARTWGLDLACHPPGPPAGPGQTEYPLRAFAAVLPIHTARLMQYLFRPHG